MTLSSLYSAFIVDARFEPPAVWRLFTYQRSQPIVSTAHGVFATGAHTNVPRSGDSGLPMGWDADINRWRALTSIRFAEPVLEWAGECEACFRYNDKIVDRRPLLDLLFSAQGVFDPDSQPTGGRRSTASVASLWMQENRTYYVDVIANVGATQKLQRWLVEHTADHRLTAWIFLEGIIRSAPM